MFLARFLGLVASFLAAPDLSLANQIAAFIH
jgi:hypothetical protein